jgi:hypothetical protein
MAPYIFADNLLHDEEVLTQFNPDLIETTSTPDNILHDDVDVTIPKRQSLWEIASYYEFPVWGGVDSRFLRDVSVKATVWDGTIETTSTPDNILLDGIGVSVEHNIFVAPDLQPTVVVGAFYDLVGYI